MAPTVICPSPPTFQSRAVNGIAAAKAVAMRIPVMMIVWLMLNGLPSEPGIDGLRHSKRIGAQQPGP